jgi:hypothetical protein
VAAHVATGGISTIVQGVKRLKKHRAKMKKYVADEGIEPSDNIPELAVQVAQAREQKKERLIDDNENYPEIQDENAAEEELQADEINEEEESGYDGEEAFTGEALGMALGMAKGIVSKVKQGRLKKGKKFLGKTGEQWTKRDLEKGKIDVNVDGGGNIVASGLNNERSTDALSMAVKSGKEEVMSQNIKKYLPYLIIGVVVLIFGRKLFK